MIGPLVELGPVTQSAQATPEPHTPDDHWATCPACGRILFTYDDQSYCVYSDCAESPRHRPREVNTKARRTPGQPPVTESPGGTTG